jgi:hypothetical protein
MKLLRNALGSLAIAALLAGVTATSASAQGLKNPPWGTSTLTGTVAGTPYDSGTSTPGAVTDQSVTFTDIDVSGVTLVSIEVPNVTVTDASAVVDGTGCTGTPTVDWSGGELTVKGISCAIGGTVTVTFSADVNAAAGTYAISSAYRTVATPPRKPGNMRLALSTATLVIA